ncbi:MAG: hypothetical protein H3Z50_07985 [archaeon]|nr:hypothetical protein [archaeon]MCP8307027.1 hypothetical protein [archaeon]
MNTKGFRTNTHEKAVTNDFATGRRDKDLMAASLYVACRKLGVPVHLNDICRHSKARRAGIKQRQDVRPHVLRKAFESALRNARLDVKD